MLTWHSSLTQSSSKNPAALRLLQGIQLTAAPDLWTFSEDDANYIQHSLNSVDKTIVAETYRKLIDFVQTLFSSTTKLLTNAIELDKMFMKSVICMASDALCEESTKDAKNTTNLFRDFMPVSSQWETHMVKRLATLVVHTQSNFCPCSHPYLRFAATTGPRDSLASKGHQQSLTSRQADLSNALYDMGRRGAWNIWARRPPYACR